jgi:hypothetical protein
LLFLTFTFENFRYIGKLFIDPKTMNVNCTECRSKCKCFRMGTVQVRFKPSLRALVYNLLAPEVTDIDFQEVGGKCCNLTVSELITSVSSTFSMTDL